MGIVDVMVDFGAGGGGIVDTKFTITLKKHAALSTLSTPKIAGSCQSTGASA